MYNGSPVAWSSKRQTISIAEATAVSSLPALSSGEAELNAITYATREAIGMRVLLHFLCELPADTADDWNGPIAIWTAAQLYRFAGQDATDQARQPTLICSDSRAFTLSTSSSNFSKPCSSTRLLCGWLYSAYLYNYVCRPPTVSALVLCARSCTRVGTDG